MHLISGQCHCGRIQFSAEFSQPLHTYSRRSCDCDFCRMHGASYVSDPQGRLEIRMRSDLHTYRQGSGTAEFLLCPECGVLIAALYREGSEIYAAVNAAATDNPAAFGACSSVSPKLLSTDNKVKRWKENWFPGIAIGARKPLSTDP